MRILFLSFYFPPDIGPGPIRAHAFVDALFRVGGDDLRVDVFTTMPNRYASLGAQAVMTEADGQLSILRFPLPPHKSGMSDQARAFASYARQVLRHVKGREWDLVIATSSRLMTQILGAWVAKRNGANLYLDIRDLFTDTIDEVLPYAPFRLAMPIFRELERRSLRQACGINVVSPGFVRHISDLAPDIPISVFTNGIDDEFLAEGFAHVQTPDTVKVQKRSELPLVLYAGNVGEGQALHRILPGVAKHFSNRVRFRVVGDGGRRVALEQAIRTHGVNNVERLDPMPRFDLMDHYREAQILFLHLNDLAAFRKVLPSKLFEYAATGKPILAGVAGEARDFLREQVIGAQVFSPCSVQGMTDALESLLAGDSRFDRTRFCSEFRRTTIMEEMARDVLAVTGKGES